MNRELPDVEAVFRKGKGIPEKNIYFCFIDYAKELTVWITKNCGKLLKRWEYQTTYLPPETPVCKPRNDSLNKT